jgi:predicted AAA+ superfamily ATPase
MKFNASQQYSRHCALLSHVHGQIFNASQPASSLDLSDHTIKRYLDILTSTFMVRQLTPWFENTKKRQIKSPKIFFRDSGIFHLLQGIQTHENLQVNPRLGSSWEGFAMEQVISACGATPEEIYFWGVHGVGELDLLVIKNGKRIGFEIKHSSKPAITPSMRLAMQELKLEKIFVIYNGSNSFLLDDRIQAISLVDFTVENKLL